MTTHTVEITVGSGQEHGYGYAAYAKCSTAGWLNGILGLAETPEEAATDARNLVELDAGRVGYTAAFVYPAEN